MLAHSESSRLHPDTQNFSVSQKSAEQGFLSDDDVRYADPAMPEFYPKSAVQRFYESIHEPSRAMLPGLIFTLL